jgi:RNA polymerase sigma factor (sigma-70 family)
LDSGGREKKHASSLAGACSDLARRSHVRADAEDAAQDAYLRALQIDQSQAIRNPRRYILAMARNLFIDRFRKLGREARIVEQSENSALNVGGTMDPERILSGKQSLDRILGIIEALPPRCRQTFILHRFENLNYAEIGKRMGISISMVEKHIAEAMARLARARKEQGE